MPETTPTTKLGKLIREARTAVHMKQWELGVEAGVAEKNAGQAISDWERGRNTPEAVRMARIIVATGVDASTAWRVWGEAQIRDDEAEAVYFAAVTSPDAEAASGQTADQEGGKVALRQAAGGLAKKGRDKATSRRKSS